MYKLGSQFEFDYSKSIANSNNIIQGNKYRERRQVNTHMSVNGCLKHIEKIATIWLKEVYLLHMSAAYGDTLISKAMVQAKLKEMNIDATVYVANERGGVC